jgi:hypothetical protein
MRLEPKDTKQLGFSQPIWGYELIYRAEDETSHRVAPTNLKPVSRPLLFGGSSKPAGFSLQRSNPAAFASKSVDPDFYCRSLPSVEIYP